MRSTLAFALVVVFAVLLCHAQENKSRNLSDQFIVNQERGFVYLEFVRLSKGTQFGDDEPQTRVWFYLVNNSRVPIVVRTFGVPEGSPSEEIGLMHDVVANLAPWGSSGGAVYPQSDVAQSSTLEEKMPAGYGGDVSSTATLGPTQKLLFSVPVNHLGENWHIEIPFKFALPHKRPPHFENAIGGQPHMELSYFLSDLPPDVRKRVTVEK